MRGCLTIAVANHGQQLLNGVAEHGLLPLQEAAVVRGAAQLALEPDDQLTLPLHQLVELTLLALQALELPTVASLQRKQPLLQEAAEVNPQLGLLTGRRDETHSLRVCLRHRVRKDSFANVFSGVTICRTFLNME